MADGAQTTLTGPAAKVAAFVNSAIARIKREAQTAVDSAVQQARADIDRIAREAADTALAEARAASAEAQKARADMAAMQAEMNETRDEIREMLDELKRRQAEHDEMFASFDDLDGDGVPDHLQAESTEIAVAPQTAPAIPDDRFEEALQRVFDRVIETLKIWRAEGGPVPVAIPANENGAAEEVRKYYDGLQVVPGNQLGKIDYSTVWLRLALDFVAQAMLERGELFLEETEKEAAVVFEVGEGGVNPALSDFKRFITEQADAYWTKDIRSPEQQKAALLGVRDEPH